MKRYLGILASVLISGLLLVGCGQFTIKGEDGEKTKIDFSDLKKGKLNVETEDKDGEKGSFNIDVDEKDGSAQMTMKGADGETGSVDIQSDDSGGTTMQMKTEEGEFDSKSGEGTELPEGFPTDFPIPTNSNILVASTSTHEDNVHYIVQLEMNGDAKSAETLYNSVKNYAEKKGLSAAMDQTTTSDGHTNYMFGAGNSDTDNNEDYFLFHITPFEEGYRIQISYNVPKE